MDNLRTARDSQEATQVKQVLCELLNQHFDVESVDWELIFSLFLFDDHWITADTCKLLEKIIHQNPSLAQEETFQEYLGKGLGSEEFSISLLSFSLLEWMLKQRENYPISLSKRLLSGLLEGFITGMNEEKAFSLILQIVSAEKSSLVESVRQRKPKDEIERLRLLKLHLKLAESGEVEFISDCIQFLDESMVANDELVLVNILEVISQHCSIASNIQALMDATFPFKIAHLLTADSEPLRICALNFFISLSLVKEADFPSIYRQCRLQAFLEWAFSSLDFGPLKVSA